MLTKWAASPTPDTFVIVRPEMDFWSGLKVSMPVTDISTAFVESFVVDQRQLLSPDVGTTPASTASPRAAVASPVVSRLQASGSDEPAPVGRFVGPELAMPESAVWALAFGALVGAPVAGAAPVADELPYAATRTATAASEINEMRMIEPPERIARGCRLAGAVG
jgi:hypothetical protein